MKVRDVGPDGEVTLRTQGHLKASYREVDEAKSKPGQPYHPYRNPVPPEPNKVYEYQIELIPIFHTFKAGHRIRVEIASDDLLHFGNVHIIYTSEMLPVPAVNTGYHNLKYPSHLVLPVIPDAPEIKPVEPPVSQITWPLPQGSSEFPIFDFPLY